MVNENVVVEQIAFIYSATLCEITTASCTTPFVRESVCSEIRNLAATDVINKTLS